MEKKNFYQKLSNNLRQNEIRLISYLKKEDGVGMVEIALIIVVLIGLAVIFKEQMKNFVERIFSEMNIDGLR